MKSAFKHLLITFTFTCSIATSLASEKVLIITHAFSRPDMIELHVKTFNAFLKEDYELVVFNDASNDDMRRSIESTCKKLAVKCYRVPQEMHKHLNSPGHRHMDGIRYAFQTVGFQHDGPLMLIDGDMFLIKPLSVFEFLDGYDIMGVEQVRENARLRVSHFSPALIFINMKTAPNIRTINFDGNYVEDVMVDVAGQTYYYIKNNPTLRYRFLSMESTSRLPHDKKVLQELGYDNMAITFFLGLPRDYCFEFYGDNYFLHYYAGASNWPGYGANYIEEKNHYFRKFIDDCIKHYTN